jgi:hypothetical protein
MSRIVLALVALAVPMALAAQKPAAPAPQSIPRAKFAADMDSLFVKIDANNDGSITRVEIDQYQKRAAADVARTRNRALFTQLDTDKNGQLSPTEFANAPTATPQVNAQLMVNRMDSNRDQKISLREHRASALTNFDKLDSNKDGMLTPSEVKAGIGRQQP